MKKFLAGLLSFVLVVGIGVGAYFMFFKNKPSEETSIMTMSVNPQVQFILDQNNKVMNVTAVNEDGVSLTTQVNFVGMSADEAAKKFVELSSQFKIGVYEFNVNATNGKEVSIYISCEDDKKTSTTIKNLQTNVQNSVNQYFKDNGILAGAKVQLSDAVDQIKMFGDSVETFTSTSFEDAMTYAKEISHEFEDISYSVRGTVKTTIGALKSTFETTNKTLISSIDSLQSQITTLQEQLNSSDLILESVKTEINKQIAELQKKLDDAKAEYQTKLNELQTKIDEKIKEFQTQCESALKTLKTQIETKVETGKQQLANYKAEIEKLTSEQKQELQTKIEEYQKSLATPIA